MAIPAARQFPNEAYREDSKVLQAYQTFYLDLLSYTANELGRNRALELAPKSVAGTPFAEFSISDNGMFLPANSSSPLRHINPKTKRSLYQKITNGYLAELSNFLPTEILAKEITTIKNRIKQSFDVTIEYQLPKKHQQRVSNLLHNLIPKQHGINQHSREQFEQLCHFLLEGILLVNQDHRIVFANSSAQQLLTLSDDQLLDARTADVLLFADANGLVPQETMFPQHAQTPLFVYQGDNVRFIQGPTAANFDITIKSLQGMVEGAAYIVLITENTTPTKQKYNADFVSVVAHELKNPLTSLRGYLAMLQDELSENVTPDQSLFLGRMAISTNQLLALIENFLAYAKIENQNLVLTIEKANIVELIEKSIADLMPQAKAKQISITFEKPPTPLPEIGVDKLRITEVITNLVVNAIKYNHTGGGVWIRTSIEPEGLVVEVADNGVGIEEEALPKLFYKYVQLGSHTNNGIGLGLYIARQIITAHHGRIWAHSKISSGSTFAFRIPTNLQPTFEKKTAEQLVEKHYFSSDDQPLAN